MVTDLNQIFRHRGQQHRVLVRVISMWFGFHLLPNAATFSNCNRVAKTIFFSILRINGVNDFFDHPLIFQFKKFSKYFRFFIKNL